jgi:hypothetical protein
MTTTMLEKYIPLSQAAKRLRLSPAVLQGLIDSGNIKAVQLNGTIAVAESDLNQVITRKQFELMRGHAISISLAAERYELNYWTIRNWITRGYIKIIKPGYRMEIDESDVAYCAAVYQSLSGVRGKRLFDENGQPYQPKHTDWATYQRERRRKKKARPLAASGPNR